MSKEAKIAMFDPNEAALNNHLFGLPFDEDECDIHVLPAPWEVTVSYGAGTAQGPEEIRELTAWKCSLAWLGEEFVDGHKVRKSFGAP